jgi:hypothetical protein
MKVVFEYTLPKDKDCLEVVLKAEDYNSNLREIFDLCKDYSKYDDLSGFENEEQLLIKIQNLASIAAP